MISKQRVSQLIAACALLILGLLIYLPRTAIGPQESDSAEMALMAVMHGNLHPPGYPLYSILSELIYSIFNGNAFFVLANSSAILQIIASLLIFLIAIKLKLNSFIGFAVAFAWLCFSPSIRTGTDAEVFALHHVLVCILMLQLIFVKDNKDSSWFKIGLVCGLASCNHHTIVLWTPMILANMYGCRVYAKLTACLAMLFGILLGLTPYLRFVYRIDFQPDFTFFGVNNLKDLLQYFLRSGYGTFSAHSATTETTSYIGNMLSYIFMQMPLTVVSFAALVIVLSRSANAKVLGLILTICLHLLFANQLKFETNFELHSELVLRFYPLIALAFCASMLFTLQSLKLNSLKQNILGLICLFPVLINLQSNLMAGNNRDDQMIDYEVRSILQQLPKNAVYVAGLDRVHMYMFYLQKKENFRTDVAIVIDGLLNYDYYLERLKNQYPFFAKISQYKDHRQGIAELAAYNSRAVFSDGISATPPSYARVPVGINWQWVLSSSNVSFDEVAARLFYHCSTWSHTKLSYKNPQRLFANALKYQVFLAPISDSLDAFKQHPAYNKLKESVELFEAGRYSDAATLCKDYLKQSASNLNSEDLSLSLLG